MRASGDVLISYLYTDKGKIWRICTRFEKNPDMSKIIEIKNCLTSVEVKADQQEGDTLRIKAYGLVFGNIDFYGDIIAEGAVDRFLASEESRRMKFCNQHNLEEVVGVVVDKGVDSTGMWVEVDVLPTTKGKDLQILLKAGAINEFSIGYYATEYHYEKRADYDSEVRVLDEIFLIEVSAVTRAANPKAVLVDMKAEQMIMGVKDMTDEELLALKEEVSTEITRRIFENI